ncbi:hypothetical protein G6F70_009007 [Rhizopus microsporus]|uniref:Uncharacterized protein n=1 Tax=Rhizopus microsporus TaxID=58291 RepID=A0A0A1P4E0_RHIZD|nr:hypothetical protein G6F71_008963 [Rhizopus microsporus]KAG1193805.1 hypothetical protein G6F70_009007 [Rhizopus microsporus]KAG1206230.1 hypothetical protein G6F69_008985 [Rhizopus microsporus]KAG1228220.1 hypothetical protein G6F67_007970 [Rhizopus microsporus]KAG1259998.1 hypothetical protein G6F68_007742 [Rhizopus microsporus]
MAETNYKKRSLIEGSIHKRKPQRPASVPTDIYVASNSKSSAIVNRVKRLMLKENHNTVTIHGLGAMVTRAISIALRAQETLNNQIELKPTTETIVLTDDIIPDDMEKDQNTQQRLNSAICIKLEAKEGLSKLQKRTGKIIHRPSRNRRNRVWS